MASLARAQSGECAAAAGGSLTTPRRIATVQAMRESVIVREVGLRDGLQILPRVLPSADKLEWIGRAHAAGLREIEVGSFVPAQLMPQLSDTAELVAYATTLPGLVVSVLVPNLKGAERAIDCGAHAMLLPLSASRAHSLANLRRTPDEVVADLACIVERRDAKGSDCRIEVGISTAFGCSIQGRVEPDEVLRLVRQVLDLGVDAVGLADTVGYADPLAVKNLFEQAFEVAGDRLATAHFHDTRGLGLANVFAAWQAGIRRFDACAGGLGGCPHAPGASGNVATEDVAWLFASMGVATGLDFAALMALREQVGRWLAGEPLHGAIWRAGLPKTMAGA
jgi:hydroxymethylglutaryl-CoA lyase